jgi:glutamine amidotransferase PdxT
VIQRKDSSFFLLFSEHLDLPFKTKKDLQFLESLIISGGEDGTIQILIFIAFTGLKAPLKIY